MDVLDLGYVVCMSMEWMNECVDGLFITQLLKGYLSAARGG
jgi:hypothetical protein